VHYTGEHAITGDLIGSYDQRTDVPYRSSSFNERQPAFKQAIQVKQSIVICTDKTLFTVY